MFGHPLIEECCQNMTCPIAFILASLIHQVLSCFAKDSTQPKGKGWMPWENLQMNISLGHIGDSHQMRFAPTHDETRPSYFLLAFFTQPFFNQPALYISDIFKPKR